MSKTIENKEPPKKSDLVKIKENGSLEGRLVASFLLENEIYREKRRPKQK